MTLTHQLCKFLGHCLCQTKDAHVLSKTNHIAFVLVSSLHALFKSFYRTQVIIHRWQTWKWCMQYWKAMLNYETAGSDLHVPWLIQLLCIPLHFHWRNHVYFLRFFTSFGKIKVYYVLLLVLLLVVLLSVGSNEDVVWF